MLLNPTCPIVKSAARVLSVDLAYKSYADIGVALLERDADRTMAQLLDLPLTGTPHPERLADWLYETARAHAVAGVCIDGPLGWKAPDTDSLHCRLSEKAVRAPGKTGLPPDGVKPRSYLAFTAFSIALFERLTMHYGYRLPGTDGEADAPFVTESFPTAAWRALQLVPVAAKSKTRPPDLEAAIQRFEQGVGFRIAPASTPLTHDQLQAVVGGIAGVRWANGEREAVTLAGVAPFRLDGSWREGYIMIPATASHAQQGAGESSA